MKIRILKKNNPNKLQRLWIRILKWKLPVGTIIRLRGMYVGEDYEIIVKK